MDPKTIANFIRFKRGTRGDPFYLLNSTEQCRDVFGNLVFTMGGWNDPRNVDQCLSALGTFLANFVFRSLYFDVIGAMHASRGQVGSFEEQCEACRSQKKRYHDCQIHPGQPQIWRKGNPCKTTLVKDIMAHSRKDAAGYVAEGNCALLPTEIMDMRNVLMSSNNIEDFRLFVMVLLSIKLFLRSDEVVKMKINHVVRDVSVVREGIVDCIAFKVKQIQNRLHYHYGLIMKCISCVQFDICWLIYILPG